MFTSDRPTLLYNAFPQKVSLFCVFLSFDRMSKGLEKSFCKGQTSPFHNELVIGYVCTGSLGQLKSNPSLSRRPSSRLSEQIDGPVHRVPPCLGMENGSVSHRVTLVGTSDR